MRLRTRVRLLTAICSLPLFGACGGGDSDGSAPPEAPPTQTFTYDPLGRLTAVTYLDGTTVTYAYDAAGNLTGKTVTTAP